MRYGPKGPTSPNTVFFCLFSLFPVSLSSFGCFPFGSVGLLFFSESTNFLVLWGPLFFWISYCSHDALAGLVLVVAVALLR